MSHSGGKGRGGKGGSIADGGKSGKGAGCDAGGKGKGGKGERRVGVDPPRRESSEDLSQRRLSAMLEAHEARVGDCDRSVLEPGGKIQEVLERFGKRLRQQGAQRLQKKNYHELSIIMNLQ